MDEATFKTKTKTLKTLKDVKNLTYRVCFYHYNKKFQSKPYLHPIDENTIIEICLKSLEK